jgi:micrococcal nuclease
MHRAYRRVLHSIVPSALLAVMLAACAQPQATPAAEPASSGQVVIDVAGNDDPNATPTAIGLRMVNTPTPAPRVQLLEPTSRPSPTATSTATPAPELGFVVRVDDGDTIGVVIGSTVETVRYLNTDAPEASQSLGELATQANRALVQDQLVTLLADVTQRDAFGRLPRYVFLQDGRFVNGELVRQGWARAVDDLPDGSRLPELRGLQDLAIQNGLGLWRAVKGPVTSQRATLRRGPGELFPEAETLNPNQPLDINAVSPDGQWYRTGSGSWIAAWAVTNAPPLDALEFATVPTPTPTPTIATETPTPAPPTSTRIPPPTVAPGIIKIISVDKDDEVVVIRNDTTQAIDLENWKLRSDNGNEICFLAGILGPGELLNIYTTRGPLGYNCFFNGPIWLDNEEDIAELYSPDGIVVSTLK